ncbi:prepilin-type N-terminal cleavage/methylation domain-containing protein [bacterium]|nr:prepilin-type N-terminal cleavage/methylation domain-containing protein [bacterium]
MINRSAFTMLELLFVIVIMGILGKFGVEFLAQAYKSFIFSNINHTLQSNSQFAVESIAARLQYRIKDSIIAKKADGTFEALAGVDPTVASSYTVLEWVGADIAGFRGDSTPYWSGIVDLNHPNATNSILVSPETNTSAADALIQILSHSTATIDDAALYFIGSNSDIKTDYAWDGNTTAIDLQEGAMHPVVDVAGDITQFAPAVDNFSGIDIYEYYQLAWSAYAISIEDYNTTSKMGNLVLHYNYQPWQGEAYTDGNESVIMENVSTFQFMAAGSVVKIQVCTKSDLVEEYSLCKEKTIF